MRRAVRPDDAVRHEIAVVRHIAEVAAIGPVRLALWIELFDAVVNPFPDVAALEAVMFFDCVPIIREAAVAVAHGVRIFTHDQRAPAYARLGPFDEILDFRIHRANHVAHAHAAVPALAGPGADRAFVMQRPRRIRAAGIAGGRVVIRPVAGFIAQRPENHAGMILVALDHAAHALDEGVGVARIAAQLQVKRVRLDVRLVHDVQAVAVAQIQPVRIIGIMRGAHGIDVELLHQAHIALQRLAAQGFAGRVVVVMPVDALDVDFFSVDQQVPVADFNPAKPDPASRALFAVRRGDRDDDRVQLGRLGRP